jgi:hypothetical protein
MNLADEVYVGIGRKLPTDRLMDDQDIWITRTNRAQLPFPNRLDSQGVVDYAHLLHTCLQTKAEYILVLEDDVVAQPGWFSRLENVVIPDLKTMTHKGRKWINVSLSWSYQYLGWEMQHVPLITWVILSVYIGTLTIVAIIRRVVGLQTTVQSITASTVYLPTSEWMVSSRKRQRRLQIHKLLLHLLSPLLLSPHMLLFFLQGRHAAMPLPFGPSHLSTCCSQSLVFSRESASYVVNHLISDGFGDERHPTPRNGALELLSGQEKWERWVYKPALWQHVGTVSGKGFENRDRGKHWGFEVELLE